MSEVINKHHISRFVQFWPLQENHVKQNLKD